MAVQSGKGTSIYTSGSSSFNNGTRSSSSSDSISCSWSSDQIEDSLTTSSCSLDIMKTAKGKARKKEKVKEFLKELKTMVNEEKPKGSRGGTLSTLEHVINSMRHIKAKRIEVDVQSQTQSSLSRLDADSGFHSSYSAIPEETTRSKLDEDCLVFVLSPWVGLVENISKNVRTALGYPWDMLLERPLMDFVSNQDQATLNKIVSLDAKDIEKLESEKNKADKDMVGNDMSRCWLSIRLFKSLDRGFDLTQDDQFLPFEVNVTVSNLRENESPDQMVHQHHSSQPNVPTSMINYGKRTCIILKCTPLKTLYRGPQCTPEVRSFTTRHDVFCNFIDMHLNAIPLLGYLPQEFMKTSVFDYYHPDDLPELYNVYQTLVSGEGKPFKSNPYRLRVKNGDYILVETEWSAILNHHRSHDVKTVICHHTVIRGPNNPDVFQKAPMCVAPIKNIAFVAKLREKIKKLLSQAHDHVKLNRNALFSMEAMPDSVSEFQGGDQVAARRPVSLGRNTFDSSLTYEHLNYKTSIRRFLQSQPKTYSSEESERRSPGSMQGDISDASDELMEPFPVDFAIPKPPSYGSSIKVLVSEQEPRDEIREDVPILSPSREEPIEEGGAPSAPPPKPTATTSDTTEPQPAYKPVTLTQEMLRAHTKMQEKLYVHQATKENTNLPSTYSPTHLKAAFRHKRFHSPERTATSDGHYRCAKTQRTDLDVEVLKPSFPLTPMETTADALLNFSGKKAPVAATSQGMNLQHLQGNNLGVGFPFVQIGRGCCLPTSASTPVSTPQWPYYSSAGTPSGPFLPLYTPETLCNSPVYTQSIPASSKTAVPIPSRFMEPTSSSSGSLFQPKYERKKLQPTRKQLSQQTNQKKGKESSVSSDNTSSMEDTTSSLLYLLESDSYCYSSCLEETENNQLKLQHRLPELPQWQLGAKWTEETEKRYVMPRRKLSRILKEDRDGLGTMVQPDLVCQQLLCFLEELDQPDCTPTLDEECEGLLFPPGEGEDCEDLLADGFTEISFDEHGVCGGCDHQLNFSSCMLNKKKVNKVKVNKEAMEQDLLSEECGNSDVTDSPKDKDDKNGHSSSTSGLGESTIPCKISDADSTTSKDSGDLTPSDQRSSEEAQSSMKESDSMSKAESDASSRDVKDGDSKEIYPSCTEINFFKKIFSPLKLKVLKICPFSKISKLSSWLSEANFNKGTEMEYQLKVRPHEEVLEKDWKISQELSQSAEVKTQFEEYKKEIQEAKRGSKEYYWISESKKTDKTEYPGFREHGSCKSELRNVIVNELMDSMMKQPSEETLGDGDQRCQGEPMDSDGDERCQGQQLNNGGDEHRSVESRVMKLECSEQQVVECQYELPESAVKGELSANGTSAKKLDCAETDGTPTPAVKRLEPDGLDLPFNQLFYTSVTSDSNDPDIDGE